MVERSDLKIVIEAINKASKDLKQIEKDLKSLADEARSVGASTKEMGDTTAGAALDFKTLASAVGLGTLGARLAEEAFEFVTSSIRRTAGAIKEATIYASRVNELGIAMNVVANNAGITAEEVTKYRDAVRDQNITTEVANTLMTRLIQNQLNYTQATEVASAAQNLAVVSGVSSSETLERIIHAITSGYPWMLKQLGLTRHMEEIYGDYALTLGKAGEELTETERKQAVMNYVLEEGAKFTGLYDLAMTNAYKKMGSLRDRVKDLAYEFGQHFEPTLKAFVDVSYDAVKSLLAWFRENQGKLMVFAQILGKFFADVIKSVKDFFSQNKDIIYTIANEIGRVSIRVIGFFEAIGSAIKLLADNIRGYIYMIVRSSQVFVNAIAGNWLGVQKAGQAFLKDWQGIQKSMITNWQGVLGGLRDFGLSYEFDLRTFWANIEGVDTSAWKNRVHLAQKAGEELTEAEIKRLKKLEEENERYAKETVKRQKDFEEQLEGLIIEHRDTWKSLREDIDEETEVFKEGLEEKEQDFKEAMEKLAEDHSEKTQAILEDLDEERRKSKEQIEEIREGWDNLIGLTKKSGADRLTNLKAQLDKELALGDRGDKSKIKALEELIKREETELNKVILTQETQRDEEVKKEEDKLNEKLEKLQAELDEELTTYEKAILKKKEKYDEDVANFTEAHDKKLSELQTKLEAEEELREKYAEDFARVGDKAAEDDIARLKRKHEEEIAEMAADHLAKVAEIQETGYDMGVAFNQSFNEGFDSSWPGVRGRVNKFKEAWLEIQRITAPFGGPFYSDILNRLWEQWGAGLQHGGVVSRPSIVGEKGYPEAVLPLGEPSRLEAILKSLGISGTSGRQVIQHFNITVLKESDVDLIMERAAFNMRHRL